MVVVGNPIGALNELAQLLNIKVTKDYSQVGDIKIPAFVCHMVFNGRRFDSVVSQTKDEALKSVSAMVVQLLPFVKVPPECLIKSGDVHVPRFSARFEDLKTPEFSRLNDASKHLLKMVIDHYLGGDELKLSSLTLAENSIDQKVSRMIESLVNWQNECLPKVLMILDLQKTKEAVPYITVAFITPGFCTSYEETEAVKTFLKIPESSYERLETLGDALIGLASITCYFDKGLTSGELTAKRQSLVGEQTLAQVMIRLGLDEYIIQRDRFSTPTTKVISDVFEALTAAIWKAYPAERQVCAERMLGYIHL